LIAAWTVCPKTRADEAPIIERLGKGDDPLKAADLQRRKLVVLYYANDLYAPVTIDLIRKRHWALTELIEKSMMNKEGSEEERAILSSLHAELKKQTDNIIRQTGDDLTLLRGQLGKTIHGLVVFRNYYNGANAGGNVRPLDTLFRSFEWSYGTEPKTSRGGTMPIPHEFVRPEYVWQPLSHPAIFRHVLREVEKEVPPADTRYLLLVRTPCTKDNMIATFLSVDIASLPTAEVRQVLTKAFTREAIAESAQSGDLWARVNQVLVDVFHVPVEAKERAKIEASKPIFPEPLLARIVEPGTSKVSFLSTLYHVGGRDFRKGMYFSLVVVASPRSAWKLSNQRDFKELKSSEDMFTDNVGRLVTWGDKVLDNDPLNLPAILEGTKADPKADLQELMLRYWQLKKPAK